MKKKLIINADDLGFSKSINFAIKEAHQMGFLTHASLMANTHYYDHAVEEVVQQCNNLKVGLHVNLTCGKSLIQNSIIAKNGNLNWTFEQLLFLRKNKLVLETIEKEIEAQILKLKHNNINISHIDGNEHVHIIPSINKIVKKLAQKHNIPRIREINESFWESIRFNFNNTPIINYIKLGLLKFLSIFNEKTNDIAFYSMLNTCMINEKNLFNYLENTKSVEIEIMLHPSLGFTTEDKIGIDKRLISFFESSFRQQEYKLCFNERFRQYL